MTLDTMQDLLVDNLRDLLSAEKQLVAALPKMAEGARAPALQQAFTDHLEETREHVTRLESAFELLGLSPRSKTCKGMEGLIEEGTEVLEDRGNDAVRDAGIIEAAQKVEHYEIATYGCVITYAEMLGEDQIAQLLKQTLSEEEAADEKLSALAESDINHQALEAGSGEADEAGTESRKSSKRSTGKKSR